MNAKSEEIIIKYSAIGNSGHTNERQCKKIFSVLIIHILINWYCRNKN